MGPELARQTEAAIARRARLWAKPPGRQGRRIRVRAASRPSKIRVKRILRPDPYPYDRASMSWPVALVQKPKNASDIIQKVADEHNLTAAQIKGRCRCKQIVKARFQAIWEVWTELGYSLTRIGRIFGGRDHTTILRSIRKHEKRMREGQ